MLGALGSEVVGPPGVKPLLATNPVGFQAVEGRRNQSRRRNRSRVGAFICIWSGASAAVP